MGDAIDLAAVRQAIDPTCKRTGAIRCPVHEDTTASLVIGLRNGQLRCKCMAGCDHLDVWNEIRHRAGTLLNGSGEYQAKVQTVYTYKGISGAPIARVLRTDLANGAKTFKQQTPDPTQPGGWKWKGPRGATPLYHLDRIAAAPDAIVVVCEGEKSADSLQRRLNTNFVASSWLGGAESVSRVDIEPLRSRDVIVWPDNDKAGKDAGAKLVAMLESVAASVRRMCVDELPSRGDAADCDWGAEEVLARCMTIESAARRTNRTALLRSESATHSLKRCGSH